MSRARDRADGKLSGKELTLDADNDSGIVADTDDLIDFKTAGSDRAFIDASGQLGLYASDDLTSATKKATLYNTGSAFEIYASSNSGVNKGLNFHTSATSGSAGLKIDGDGHVTMPSQPSFHVVVGSGGYTNNTDVNPIPYDTEVFDTNNDFNNTASGTNPRCFTAPVAGKYWFYAHQYYRIYDEESPYIRFQKNGSDYYQYGQIYMSGITQVQGISQISACISLSANDYVQVKWVDNGGDLYYGTGESIFTGFLIG